MTLRKLKIIDRALLGLQIVCLMAAGSAATVTWYTYHPDKRPQVTEITYRLVGDVNSDKRVDQLDLNIVKDNYGKTPATYEQGDLNGDGKVDGMDLSIVLAKQGSGELKTILI